MQELGEGPIVAVVLHDGQAYRTPDASLIDAIRDALDSTLPGVLEELARV